MSALSFTTRLCIGHVAVPNECGRQPRERRDDGSAIRATGTKHAPWYVVPADNKWFTRMVVAAAIVKTLGSLGLTYPKLGPEKLQALAAAKKTLLGEK
jgi:hypothetical protein